MRVRTRSDQTLAWERFCMLTSQTGSGGGDFMKRILLVINVLGSVLPLSGWGASQATSAPAAIRGHVYAGKSPLRGAIVTIRADGATMETSVYTDESGGFVIRAPAPGRLSVRGRFPGREDSTVSVEFVDGRQSDLRLNLEPASDPLLNAPSSAWLAQLPDGLMKRKFIVNCGTCHEFSHTRIYKDGKIRDQEHWTQAITLMKAMDVYSLIPPELDTARYARWLSEAFTPKRISAMKPATGASGQSIPDAVITEYALPRADELPHDIALGPDKRLWITGFWHSEMLALDSATGKVEAFPVTLPGQTEAPAQVRALQLDGSGKFWVVLGGSKSVAHFDPISHQFQSYPIDMYAHDVVIDSKGDVWFNDYFSKPEQIGRLSASGGPIKKFALPSSNMTEAEGKPLPYGLQVDREDRLWSTQLAGNTMVRFDITTGESKLYRFPVPYSGPRRHAVGLDGAIWVPEFATGYLDRFDPKTEKFQRFSLGNPTLGAYAIAIDPKSGKIWIAAALASALMRFDPATQKTEVFPLPTEPAYMRHLAVDPDTGDVWSAYSSLPTAVPKVVRLSLGGKR